VKALVTGGGGFLGTEICRRLRARGDEVTSVSRCEHPHLRDLGVVTQRANLADVGALDALARLAQGCDVVFHVAAKAGVWGRRRDYLRTNVLGTQNVIAACLAASVPRLVYTSSPSVCFDGSDQRLVCVDLPYAERFLAHYPESKARAEQLVLAANGPALATCALRPHLIFGPHDPHLCPRLVAEARAGRLAVVGDGCNEVTLCYVDNAAQAHLGAAQTLIPGARHAGRAYFIGQEQPVVLWEWIRALLTQLGIPVPRRRISLSAAHRAGHLLELLWRTLPLPGEPRMTRFIATQLATSHSYSMTPARDDFGYREVVDLDTATARTIAWLSESA
jgi:nucleoside-diphosphate-sugar epimerase